MRYKLIVLIIITVISAGSMAAAAAVDEDIAVVQKLITTYSGYRNNPYSVFYPIQLQKHGLISAYIRPVDPEMPFAMEGSGSVPTFHLDVISVNAFDDMNDEKWNSWLNDIEGITPSMPKTVARKHIYGGVIIKDRPRQLNYPVDVPELGRTGGKYVIWIRSVVRPTVKSVLIIRYPGSRHYFDPDIDRYRRVHSDLVVDSVTLNESNNLEVQIKNIGQATFLGQAAINGGYWHLQGERAVTLIAEVEGRKYGATLAAFDPDKKLRKPNQAVSYTFDTVNINNKTEVKVTVDYSDILIEKNEDNNEKVVEIGGTGEAGFMIEAPKISLNTSLETGSSDAKPDLKVKAVTLSDQNEIVIELQNVGEGSIDENFWNESNVILHLKKDGSSWANIYKSSFDPDNELINPGGSVIYNTEFILNQEAAIKASIDESDVIDEADEDNNIMEALL